MKVTIEISDGLFEQAERHAAEHRMTLHAVIEAALRQFLQASNEAAPTRFRVRRHTFGGRGLQSGLDARNWGAIRDRAYEGGGG